MSGGQFILPEEIPLFLAGEGTLIDVRASIEFERGHIPGSINAPILDTEERAQVGLAYKREGPTSALSLGHRLVSGERKEGRVSAWKQILQESKRAAVTCFRGGQRSAIAQEWLSDRGYRIPRVRGGTKAIRRVYLELLGRAGSWPLLVIAGPTGSGKTALLQRLSLRSLDLEQFAEHRGSAFGRTSSVQPSQVTFENRIAQRVVSLPKVGPWLVEDESAKIGRLFLPIHLWRALQSSPVWEIKDPLERRIERIKKEYVDQPSEGAAVSHLRSQIQASLIRLTPRMGKSKVTELLTQIERAFRSQASHESWIRTLLLEYYDPLYLAAKEKQTRPLVGSGSWQEAFDALKAPRPWKI